MGRIFVTGDKHGNYDTLKLHLESMKTSKKDVVIVLGDHGTLYYGPRDDRRKKRMLHQLPATFILIRGNHDRRPDDPLYPHELKHIESPEYSGDFYVDPEFPSVLYTKEFGWYHFAEKPVFVIGGAYSVDKFRRLQMCALGFTNYHWFANEQLSKEEQQAAKQEYLCREGVSKIHCIMSHTCPIRYKPWDALMGSVDQSTVDETTEKWLDVIEDMMPYKRWYCGHWHINRSVDKMRFMYEDVELFGEIEDNKDESGN